MSPLAVGLVAVAAACDLFSGSAEAQLYGYLRAVSAGNGESARAYWLPLSSLATAPYRERYIARRDAMTAELLALHLRPSYTTRSIDWWSICCQARRVQATEANNARIAVELRDPAGVAHTYTVEAVRDVGADGFRSGPWRIWDVYRDGMAALYHR